MREQTREQRRQLFHLILAVEGRAYPVGAHINRQSGDLHQLRAGRTLHVEGSEPAGDGNRCKAVNRDGASDIGRFLLVRVCTRKLDRLMADELDEQRRRQRGDKRDALVPTSFVISSPPPAVRLEIASSFSCERKCVTGIPPTEQ